MEKTNGLKRSETWNKIYDIVKTLPREKVSGDAPDASSVTTSIEQLFLKLLAINDVSHRRELLKIPKTTKEQRVQLNEGYDKK